MSFPRTAVLDDFNRADGDLGANWQELMRSGNDFNIDTNQATDDGWNGEIYNPATYGPDSEIYATIATLQAYNETVILYLRLKDTTPDAYNYDGYALLAHRFDNGGTDTMKLRVNRYDDGAGTQLGASVDITDHGNGDKTGLRAAGTALELWYDNGAGWELRIQRSDATYATAGYLGMYLDATTTVRIDDFGGGTISLTLVKMHHYMHQT